MSGIGEYDILWDRYKKTVSEMNDFADQSIKIITAYRCGAKDQLLADTVREEAASIRQEKSWEGEVANSCCDTLEKLAARIDKEYALYCQMARTVSAYYREELNRQKKELESCQQELNPLSRAEFEVRMSEGRYML